MDQVGSTDSVTILTLMPSHVGAASGFEVSGFGTLSSPMSTAVAFNGPVCESNGLRARTASPERERSAAAAAIGAVGEGFGAWVSVF